MGRYNLSSEAAETDEELGNIISKLGGLSEDKIRELLPQRVDQDELNRLITKVNEANSENQKRAALSKGLGVISAVVKDVVLKLV